MAPITSALQARLSFQPNLGLIPIDQINYICLIKAKFVLTVKIHKNLENSESYYYQMAIKWRLFKYQVICFNFFCDFNFLEWHKAVARNCFKISDNHRHIKTSLGVVPQKDLRRLLDVQWLRRLHRRGAQEGDVASFQLLRAVLENRRRRR